MIKVLPQVIAHRGASLFAPENTLPAFELAKIMEAPMFECDVQLSQDNVPIIIHDDTVDRTTFGHGGVHNFTYRQLKELKIKNDFDLGVYQFDHAFEIPTLLDVLNWCIKSKTLINLELKANSLAPDTPLVARVLEVIRPLPVALADLMLVSSFDWQMLSEFHEQAPEFAIEVLVDKSNFENYHLSGIQETVIELNALSINVDVDLLDNQNIAALKDLAPYLLSYTVDDPLVAHDLFDAGVNGVFSNNPLLLQKLT